MAAAAAEHDERRGRVPRDVTSSHLKVLEFSNLRSYGQNARVVFDRTLNLIVGPNGSGKTVRRG